MDKLLKNLAHAISQTEMSPANRARLALETGEVLVRAMTGFNLDKWVELCDGRTSPRRWFHHGLVYEVRRVSKEIQRLVEEGIVTVEITPAESLTHANS